MQCQLHSGHDSAVCVMQEISLVLPASLMQETRQERQVLENRERQEMGRKEQAKEANVGQREADK